MIARIPTKTQAKSNLFIWESSLHYKEKCDFIFHFIENRIFMQLPSFVARPFFNKC